MVLLFCFYITNLFKYAIILTEGVISMDFINKEPEDKYKTTEIAVPKEYAYNKTDDNITLNENLLDEGKFLENTEDYLEKELLKTARDMVILEKLEQELKKQVSEIGNVSDNNKKAM